MTEYRGRHSRPGEEDSSTTEQPAINRYQPIKSPVNRSQRERSSQDETRPALQRERSSRDETRPALQRERSSRDDARPALGRVRSTQSDMRPVQGSTRSTQSSARPAQYSAWSAQDATRPAQSSTRPVQGATRSAQGATRLAQGATRSAQGATRPAQDATRPVQGNARSADKYRKPRSVEASSNAFKLHESVNETGARLRHSPLRTLIIVVPLLIVMVVAVVLVVRAIRNIPPAEEPVAGIAVIVTIPEGSSTSTIATILKNAQVIRDTRAFVADVRSMSAESSLKPGRYELLTLMDSRTLINLLVSGPNAEGNKLIIPEGLTLEKTAEVVEAACGIPRGEFLARARSASTYVKDYPFLADVYNNSLEGFLYPKTYNIPKDANADYVIRVLLDQFAKEIIGLNLTYALDHGMNLYYVVVLASLVEKETSVDSERALVSSVAYNRMGNNMMLQFCSSVIYAIGPSYDGHPLLDADTWIDSPYNTYRIYELPAGPICSPSILSIRAAAQPADTDYLYFIAVPNEPRNNFFATEQEFAAAKEEYNRIMGLG